MKKINSYKSMDRSKPIRLNSNEISTNMYRDSIFSMTSILSTIQFNRYPEDNPLALKKAYGKYAGVSEKNIIVGNGSDEMINLMITSTISKGKKLLTLDPDFSMFEFYTSLQDGKLVKVDINRNGKVDIGKLIRKGRAEDVSLIIVSNPNNPSGVALSNEDIIRVCEAFDDIPIVIDEAYYEFYGETMIGYINKYKNLIITRTLSKAWGLSSLRVGFLIACEEKVNELIKYKAPYNVNSISQALAAIALGYVELVRQNTATVIEERENLIEELKRIEKESCMDIVFYPSKANFIFGRTSYKEALINGLKNKNILIRDFEDDDSFRITIGTYQENKKLVEALESILIYQGDYGYEVESI